MDRLDILRRGITKDALGIEIGPYFAPLVPKASGYNALSIDVFDAAELKRRARADPNIRRLAVARIEPVDLIGSAGDIARLAAARTDRRPRRPPSPRSISEERATPSAFCGAAPKYCGRAAA